MPGTALYVCNYLTSPYNHPVLLFSFYIFGNQYTEMFLQFAYDIVDASVHWENEAPLSK